MGNLLAYSGTATKIRGMRRKLLTAKDFQHLASLTSFSDAIGFLNTKAAFAGIFANPIENTPFSVSSTSVPAPSFPSCSAPAIARRSGFPERTS